MAVSSCTLGMGDIIVPGIRLDQESFYLELPGAPQAGKKKKSRWWSRREERVAAKIVELIVMSELQDEKERPEIGSRRLKTIKWGENI